MVVGVVFVGGLPYVDVQARHLCGAVVGFAREREHDLGIAQIVLVEVALAGERAQLAEHEVVLVVARRYQLDQAAVVGHSHLRGTHAALVVDCSARKVPYDAACRLVEIHFLGHHGGVGRIGLDGDNGHIGRTRVDVGARVVLDGAPVEQVARADHDVAVVREQPLRGGGVILVEADIDAAEDDVFLRHVVFPRHLDSAMVGEGAAVGVVRHDGVDVELAVVGKRAGDVQGAVAHEAAVVDERRAFFDLELAIALLGCGGGNLPLGRGLVGLALGALDGDDAVVLQRAAACDVQVAVVQRFGCLASSCRGAVPLDFELAGLAHDELAARVDGAGGVVADGQLGSGGVGVVLDLEPGVLQVEAPGCRARRGRVVCDLHVEAVHVERALAQLGSAFAFEREALDYGHLAHERDHGAAIGILICGHIVVIGVL